MSNTKQDEVIGRILITLVEEWSEFVLHGDAPDGVMAVIKAKQAITQQIEKEVERAIRKTWNMSGEGWNAEYTGVNYDVEEEIVKSVLGELKDISTKLGEK